MSMPAGFDETPSPNAASSTMSLSPGISGTPASGAVTLPLPPVKRRAPIACRRYRNPYNANLLRRRSDLRLLSLAATHL
jgi:hypothetical protein